MNLNVETMTLEELRTAVERCQRELAKNTPEELEKRAAEALKAKEDAALHAVLVPGPESAAALVAATQALDKAVEASTFQARHARQLEEFQGAAASRIRRLIEIRNRDNLAAAVVAMKPDAESAREVVASALPVLVTYAVLDGARFREEDTIRLLANYWKLDLAAMFTDAHNTAAKVRAGEITL